MFPLTTNFTSSYAILGSKTEAYIITTKFSPDLQLISGLSCTYRMEWSSAWSCTYNQIKGTSDNDTSTNCSLTWKCQRHWYSRITCNSKTLQIPQYKTSYKTYIMATKDIRHPLQHTSNNTSEQHKLWKHFLHIVLYDVNTTSTGKYQITTITN